MNVTMNITNNEEVHLEVEPAYHPYRDVLLLTLYSITSLFAVICNLCVCKVVISNKQMRTKTNLLIVSMAISDIIAGAVIPVQWLFCSHKLLFTKFGQFTCGLLKSFQMTSYFLSTLTMVTIAILRYLDIFHHSRFVLTGMKFNVKVAIVSTWLIAIVFVAITAVSIRIFKYFTPKEIITCGVVLEFTEPFDSKKIRKIRVAFLIIGQFLLPLIITAAMYARIALVVFRRQVVGESSENRTKRLSESKKKTILMLVIVLIVFTICWLPVHIHHLYDFFVSKKNIEGYCNNSTSYFILYWLAISSCCYNPIIYYFFNPKFHNAFKKMFREASRTVATKLQLSDVTATNNRSDNSKLKDTSETTI